MSREGSPSVPLHKHNQAPLCSSPSPSHTELQATPLHDGHCNEHGTYCGGCWRGTPGSSLGARTKGASDACNAPPTVFHTKPIIHTAFFVPITRCDGFGQGCSADRDPVADQAKGWVLQHSTQPYSHPHTPQAWPPSMKRRVASLDGLWMRLSCKPCRPPTLPSCRSSRAPSRMQRRIWATPR